MDMMKTPKEIMNDAMKGWHGDDGVHDTDGTHIIEALDAAGYVIVPKEPTEEMDEAGWAALPFFTLAQNVPTKDVPQIVKNIYRVMLSAAQNEESPPTD